MRWHDLAFLHWPIDYHALRAIVPSRLEIDTHEGRAWIGIVPFHMTGVLPRGVPALPAVSAFVELNVRTYVTVGGRAGVYFFSLDAASGAAVAIARRTFHLPYYHADMAANRTGDRIAYRSARTHRGAEPAEFVATYRPTCPVFTAEPGSLEHWLTERYCLYTIDPRERVCRGEIHHGPWPLQRGVAQIERNTMTQPLELPLPDAKPLVHFARRLDVVAWRLTRV